MGPDARVALAARAFTLAGLVSVAGLLGSEVLPGALAALFVAVWAQIISAAGHVPGSWVVTAEGALVGLLAAGFWPNADAITPYLVVPVLVGSFSGGVPGILKVIAAEALAGSTAWGLLNRAVDRGTVAQILLWLVAAMGLGLLGTAFRRAADRAEVGAPYRDALELIKGLHALSGRLTEGLDAVGLADDILKGIMHDLPVVQGVVLTKSPSATLVPLRFSDGASTTSLLSSIDWVERVWDSSSPVTRGRRVALPLRTDDGVIAVLVADCIPDPDGKALAVAQRRLEPKAVELYAALLFSDIRDTATSQERQRLAREVHDGVAQDVASLGYLVDNLVDMARDEEQARVVQELRHEVTRVVAELRHSVFDLRNEAGLGQGLGQSLSSFARHIGSHSELTVHVTLNEAPARLRPDVESEMLRIAQEAINNARKHSGGRNLWVHCTVEPPAACIEVRDDGSGLGPGRYDSHGLRIMRERAERIGAELAITSCTEGPGTRVLLQLPSRILSLSEA